MPSAELTRRSFPPWIQCLPDSLGGRQCFYIYVYILQSPWWVVIDRLYTVDRLDSVLCLAEFSFWSSNWSLCSGKGRRARCRHFDLFVHHTCGSKLYSGSIWHTLVCEMQFGQLGIRPEWPVASHVREKLRVWTFRFEDILNFETFPSIFKPSKCNPLTQKRQHPRRRQRRRSPRLPVVPCLWPWCRKTRGRNIK